MQNEITPGPSPKATALMTKVQQTYREIHSFHSIVLATTTSGNPLDPTPDPCMRMETWFDHPNARTEVSVEGDFMFAFVGDERFWYKNIEGSWTKKERKIDPLNDTLFGVFGIIRVETFASVSKQTLKGHTVWVVQGISKAVSNDDLQTQTTWWIDQRTNHVRRVRMEISEAKKGPEAMPPDITTLECQVFEPNIDIPDEKFRVPPDVPFGEPTFPVEHTFLGG